MIEWNPEADQCKVECVHVGSLEVRHGDRVRPRSGGDMMDLALAGMTATVDSIEQDFEGRVYLAVTVDDDPGRDLGDASTGASLLFPARRGGSTGREE